MTNESESRTGWNGTCVRVGSVCEVMGLPDMGRSTRVRVLALGEPPCGYCEVEVVRVTDHTRERCGVLPGRRYDIGPWWLVGEPMM